MGQAANNCTIYKRDHGVIIKLGFFRYNDLVKNYNSVCEDISIMSSDIGSSHCRYTAEEAFAMLNEDSDSSDAEEKVQEDLAIISTGTDESSLKAAG